ncbi:MAG: hypothetical protein QNJ35_12240 [Paracoccaceae bacterium]|nr:hypothetical protein [Paracoccaceae bacterium]
MNGPAATGLFPTLIDFVSGPVGSGVFLTAILIVTALKLRGLAGGRAAGRKKPDLPDLPRELLIPVVEDDPDSAARANVVERVSELVGSEGWGELADLVAEWESRLDATPAGVRHHDLAADTILAPLEALIDEVPRQELSELAQAEQEVERLVALHKAHPDAHVLAAIAARAQMILAESCQAEFWPDDMRKEAWRKMAHHYVQAEAILEAFDPVAYMSPLLGRAVYELALGMPDRNARLKPAYEDWIDLDPSDPAIYARHATSLLPHRFGSIAEIRVEADRAEARTRETLGKSGYALFMLPLIEADEDMRSIVEPDRLAAGLMDLARLSGTQAEVNWAAATLARESRFGALERQDVLASAFEALVRRHLGVLYPRVWRMPLAEVRSLLAPLFSNDKPVGNAATPPETAVREAA